MSRFDAVVVGGGPAGSTAARELSRAGLDVLVLDRAEFPRHKVCAGWITPAVLETLDIEPSDYRGQGLTLQPIRGFRVAGVGGAIHRVPYRQPVSYGIRRCEFDDYLLRRSGARLRLGEPLRSLERRDGEWWIDGSIRTPLIVGAGGHSCPVARHLAPHGREEVVAAQEVELRLADGAACRVEPERPELFFHDDLKGYGWCFRKGRYLNVGLGSLDASGFAARVAEFVARLQAEGRIPADLGPFEGHAYLLRNRSSRPLVRDGAMLVGDAAGLAYSTSGEGIRPAVESGLLAARAAIAAGGDYRADRLAVYPRWITSRLGRAEDRRRRDVTRWQRALARRLFASPWFARRILIDRLFLHRHVAPI
ncbi:MAG: geranylgeranyl reductase family protein [Thermoanaerobaculia bacterium]|nr:geranylgeranyl reductase family protein [Thermoanaerobaculia bacterium]